MPRPPSQRGLQAFRHSVLTGSVTGAAAVLGRTQPAISRLLKELEADIGFALFERVRGRMAPTPEGRLFLEELQRAFAGFERIVSVAAEIRQGRRGTLRVATMPAAAAACFLPRVVRRFTEANPGTAIALQVLPSADVARLVQTQDCDLGVVEGTLSPPALTIERRYAIPCAVVMPAGHPLARRRRLELRDLAGQDFVALSPYGSSIGAQLEALLAREGVECRTRAETHLTHIVSALVLEGVGIGVVDLLATEAHAARGGVARPLATEMALEIHLVRPATSPPPAMLQALMRLCDEAIDALVAGP
jgi:DNA-binding transcriptional LysR family regulator